MLKKTSTSQHCDNSIDLKITMAEFPEDKRGLFREETSNSFNTSTAIGSIGSMGSPRSPIIQMFPQRRHSYHRTSSMDFADVMSQEASIHSINEDEPEDRERNVHGLGIATGRSPSINPVSIGANRTSPNPASPSKKFLSLSPGANSPLTPLSPGSQKPLLSPAWVRLDSGTYTYGHDGGKRGPMHEEKDISRRKLTAHKEGLGNTFPNYDNDRRPRTVASSINDNDSTYRLPISPCATNEDIHTGRGSWLSISIMGLSIYSTVFSAIWLTLALVRPRYGRAIHSGGDLTPATASIVFSLVAKTIELSFVTVFVTFLGQVLSRRSLVKSSRGVTIAEMSMRTWVIQPGFMITHWKHFQHVGFTLLGVISLTAAIMAMFYTTASNALVSPHLKYGRWENKEMYGWVQTSYANPTFIMDNCQTPVTKIEDPYNAGLTCLSVEHAGQAYHNTLAYLETWAAISTLGVGESSNITQRPQPMGMLFDNTTVTGSWVETNFSDMTASYEKYNRIINNVTVSMPHAGIFAAARDEKNAILQPAELAGVGEYTLKASVVSPTVNVLCVNMNATELAPLIYVTWPNAHTINNTALPGQRLAWPGYQNEVQLQPGESYLNSTVVDDIFEWGATYERQPPVFPMLPIDYNTITNVSVASSDSIYILGKAPASSTTDYTVCQMRSYLSPSCSTRYNVSGTNGGYLEANCDDPSDPFAYSKSVKDAPVVKSTDWRNVISEWALSLSLNTGISNANASTSRLLTQFIPYYPGWGDVKLNPLKPSIAETLAVMSICTLLVSTTSSTFYHYWQYQATILDPGVYQAFNASISSQQYTSGYTQNWQCVFYIVLLLVFATNVFCLVYFFLRAGLVTDFTEPPNLFALAINSPPSSRLSGSCGAGPEGHQLNVDFHIEQDELSEHVYIREGGSPATLRQRAVERRFQQNTRSMSSYSKLSNTRKTFL